MKRNDYLEQLKGLLVRAHPRLTTTARLEFKNCFGAVAAYINGNIFATCGSFGMALKLPPDILIDLFKEPGVTHLKYFAKGHVKKDYAVIPPGILRNRSRLRALVDISVKNALSRSR